MSKELQLLKLKNRFAILSERDPIGNSAILKKIQRKIKNLSK